MSARALLGGLMLTALFIGLVVVMSCAMRRWWAGPAIMLASMLMTGVVVLSVYLMVGSL